MSWDDHIIAIGALAGTIIIVLFVVLVGALTLQPGPETQAAEEIETATPTPTSTAIVNGSTPTPSPSPNATTTIPPGVLLTYDEYIRDVGASYGVYEPPWTEKKFVDPLSQEGYQLYLEWSRVNPSTRSFDGVEYGVRIYTPTPIPKPTPTPVPTPDPFARERLTPLKDGDYLPPSDHTSTISGQLAWDPDRSHGLQPYYYRGDHLTIQTRLVSTSQDTIKDPLIGVVIKKEVGLGVYTQIFEKSWTESITIPPLGAFYTRVFEYDVPKYIGNYILEISVRVNGKEECWISEDVTIF